MLLGGGRAAVAQDKDGGGSPDPRPSGGGLLHEKYAITDYVFAYYEGEQDGWWIFGEGVEDTTKKLMYATFNSFASAVFLMHLLFMKTAVTVMQWVLTVDLIDALKGTISGGIRSMGQALIGSGADFSGYVKIMWALGLLAVAWAFLKRQVVAATGHLLKLVLLSAFALFVVLNPGAVIDTYSSFTTAGSNAVFATAARIGGDDFSGAGERPTVSEGFLNTLWEAYVIAPWAQIQISSDPRVANEHAEEMLSTSTEDRPDKLEGIKDEKGVDPRATLEDAVMHIVLATTTLIFGLAVVIVCLVLSLLVFVFEAISIVALIALPVWLLFAIFPAGGLPFKLGMWFIHINVDVLLGKLALSLFVTVCAATVGLGAQTSEDMRLITSFLVSIIAGIGVWVLIFNVRSILRASSFGRTSVLRSPAGHPAGAAPAPAASAPAEAAETGASQRMSYASDNVRKAMDRVENERNEAGRQQAGMPPMDSRSRGRKVFETARSAAMVAGSYASAGAGAAATAGKAGHAVHKAAASGNYMPSEMAAAILKHAAAPAARGGARAAGAAGAGALRRMDPGSAYNERRNRDARTIKRFEEDGEDLARSVAARKTNDLIERDRRIRQNVAEQMNEDYPHYEDYEPPPRQEFTEQEWREGKVYPPPNPGGGETEEQARERRQSKRVYLSAEQWRQRNPQRYQQLYKERAREEFGTEYSMFQKARERMSDPQSGKAAYDQPFIMEAARQEVAQGLREGRTDDEIRAGISRPGQTGKPEQHFRDRLREVRQMRRAQESATSGGDKDT